MRTVAPARALFLLTICSAIAACGGGEIEATPTRPVAATGGTAGAGGSASGAGGTAGQSGAGGQDDRDPSDWLKVPKSCVYKCPADCLESTTPYVCPALAPWTTLPHAESCGAWDGQPPKPETTQCKASLPTGDAAKFAGRDADHPGTWVMPGGRRVTPAGKEWVFNEKDLEPIQPAALMQIPGTSWMVVLDAGDGPHTVRVVDRQKLEAGVDPVLSMLRWNAPDTLNWGMAFVPPDLLLVATAQGMVEALTVDPKTGALKKDPTRNIPLPQSVDDTGAPAPFYVAALALAPDQKTLLVTSVFDTSAFLFDVSQGSYGVSLGKVPVGKGGAFAAAFDPTDGTRAYLSMWGGHKLLELDLSQKGAPAAGRTFAIEKNPQGIAFLDARFIAVANDYGDAIALVDRTTGAVTSVPVNADALPGLEPSTLAYDANRKVLYATLAGVNAVEAWSVDVATTPPTLTPLGRIPTSWWPTGVIVLDDGAVAVTTMRGHSVTPEKTADGVHRRLLGTISLVPAPAQAELAAWETVVASSLDVGALPGASKVTCPPGVSDFPVPATNTEGPSKRIDHVIMVLRENKTFDQLLGDLDGVKGDPTLTAKKSKADMDGIWGNFRALSRAFAVGDNYYTESELSNQGHTWMTFGRTSDFTERTWTLNNYSRSTYKSAVQPQGISDIGTPLEGSAFDWLGRNKIQVDVLGEGEGSPTVYANHPPIDFKYPGGFVQSISHPDIEKACYVAARARTVCDLAPFVYMTLPNDHTAGTGPTSASPETMIATNDEATGMLVDAISHSAIWKSSLIIVVEDDPGDGIDHVERHRSPALFVSPWVKRHYATRTNLDEASLYKIVAHVLGAPYPNQIVRNAAVPYDLFSDTPDYTPYDYKPRTWPRRCGADTTAAELKVGASWDLRDVDREPGLDEQVRRYLRGEPRTTVAAPPPTRLHTRRGRAVIDDDDD